MLQGEQFNRPLGQSCDSCKGVDTNGSWHDGTVADNQPLVDFSAIAAEDLAYIVDNSGVPRSIFADSSTTAKFQESEI